MNKLEINRLDYKPSAKMVVKFAMDALKCETTEELKELCYDIIDAIVYLNQY